MVTKIFPVLHIYSKTNVLSMSLRITIPLVSIPQSLQDHENDELFISMVDDTTQREVAIPAVYILGKNGWVLLPIFVVILFELTYTVGILYTTYMWIQILRGQCRPQNVCQFRFFPSINIWLVSGTWSKEHSHSWTWIVPWWTFQWT